MLSEMFMIGVDTNILVRFFTQDYISQVDVASKVISKYSTKENSIFISNIVICELVWVLARGINTVRKRC